MSADLTTVIAALGVDPTYSAREAAAMLGLRTPGGYRRFTLQMLRHIIVASACHDWFSAEDTRFTLRAVITANYCETGEYKITS